MRIGRGNWINERKPARSAALYTTDAAWSDLGWNPGRRNLKLATDRLSYGTADINLA
jgi:hypothetical protein